MTIGLRVDVVSRVPPVEVAAEVDSGSTVAVVGRNGAGKTSLLNLVAGLHRPAAGAIEIGGRVVTDGSAFTPPHRRSVALLGQQARLFPHMTVAQNVGFAPAAAHLGRNEIRRRVRAWCDAVDVAHLAGRKPHQLSGGQAQRVAIARALAADPAVLLLDEPFAALDVDVAGRVREVLATVLADRSRVTLLVTHDLVDAVTLADTAMVLADGRLIDNGSVREVLSRPADDFVARLAGVNRIDGVWEDGAVVSGPLRVAGRIAPAAAVAVKDPAVAVFDPSAVVVAGEHPGAATTPTTMAATVREVAPLGARVSIRCDAGGRVVTAEIPWAAASDMGLRSGSPVLLGVRSADVMVHPAPPMGISRPLRAGGRGGTRSPAP